MKDKQRKFVAEYLTDLNATQAALRAGYSPKTAHQQGYALLRNPDVQAAITTATEQRAKRTAVTADKVVMALDEIAFADIGETIRVDDDGRVTVRKLDDLPVSVRRCISEITQKTTEVVTQDGRTIEKVQLSVKFHSKTAALKMLMDHLGMNAPTKQEVSVHVARVQAMNTGQLDAVIALPDVPDEEDSEDSPSSF